ncbi:TIGR03943 family putative permease subunit [Amphibacillus cookii]|uniref:TIGR03943 family putative permease subunit n=1 Tax=Amphibacillus cookii TaxID=767787 RepID=UPI001955FDA9|nr:TIGR03943 family protein [Amphibacillus cookii]MBM7542983.1 putative membrane protein [Amphibacillus cookii]
MRFSFIHAFRAMILLLFVLLVGDLYYSGELFMLINPDYQNLNGLAVFILIILFLVQLQRVWFQSEVCGHACEHDHAHDQGTFNIKTCLAYLIIVFPIFTGFILPFTTLDASTAANRGVMLSLTSHALSAQNAEPFYYPNATMDDNHQYDTPEDINLYSNMVTKDEYENALAQLVEQDPIIMTDQDYSIYYEAINKDMENFSGKKITLNGFVYKNPSLDYNQVVIGRFLITHCIADASYIGFLAELNQAPQWSEDAWVAVTGVIKITEYEGVKLPMIQVEEWEVINEPDQPYLYPMHITIR